MKQDDEKTLPIKLMATRSETDSPVSEKPISKQPDIINNIDIAEQIRGP
jgi:hypothetical protein